MGQKLSKKEYNIYVMGPRGVGKTRFIDKIAGCDQNRQHDMGIRTRDARYRGSKIILNELDCDETILSRQLYKLYINEIKHEYLIFMFDANDKNSFEELKHIFKEIVEDNRQLFTDCKIMIYGNKVPGNQDSVSSDIGVMIGDVERDAWTILNDVIK